MTLQEYVDEIKLVLTGGVLTLEITDDTIAKTVNRTLKEIQRYIDTTKLVTVPFASCIDLTNFKHSSIVNVFPTSGVTSSMTISDPFAAQILVWSNGFSSYNLHEYLMNYLAYSQLAQISNNISTSLDFIEDKTDNRLYINQGSYSTSNVTIEYIPKYDNVEEITSDYWIDILYRMSLAYTKIILGRIRTRFTQSNALWTMDGETLLEEGNTELTTLQETLRVNKSMMNPVD